MSTTYMPNQEELLAKAIYVYANYDKLQKKATEEGSVMKEGRDFYAFNILNIIERNFKEMPENRICSIITDSLILNNHTNEVTHFHTLEEVAMAVNEKFGAAVITSDDVVKGLIDNHGATNHMGTIIPKDYAFRIGEFFVVVHDYGDELKIELN